MKWTLTIKNGKFIVKFIGESPISFSKESSAMAYINDKVLTTLGV